MRTTVTLENATYQRLVQEAIARYGSAKNISRVLNELLESVFRTQGAQETMFGEWKAESRKNLHAGLREEGEPH